MATEGCCGGCGGCGCGGCGGCGCGGDCGGGCGTDGVYSERVCSCKLTRMQLSKNGPVQVHWSLWAGLTSRKLPTPVHPEGRFQATPKQKPQTQPQGEEKDCGVTPPHSLSFGGRDEQSFPSPRRWMSWIQSDMRRNNLNVSSW